jgi:aminopeptidase YwaD
MENHFIHLTHTYLDTLCRQIPTRLTGSAGNRAAVDFFADRLARLGFQVEMPGFDCLNWEHAGASLNVAGSGFTIFPAPFSPPCALEAPLLAVSSLAGLEAADLGRRILLLHGEIAAEQLFPKNFPFFTEETHQRIYALLEQGQPLAVLAAPGRNSGMAGAAYPYPLIEDGDFSIPSAYLSGADGAALAALAGQPTRLEIRSRRIPAHGANVHGFLPGGSQAARRVMLTAHIDAKPDTPGALDNAAGVITLLLLAERLAQTPARLPVEIVAVNGEDYYASSGERLIMEHYAGRWDEIALGINLDALGYYTGRTAYSLYECPDGLAAAIRANFSGEASFCEGEPWFQGDHFLFMMNQRPALALTSEMIGEMMTEVVHTASDTPERVNPARLVEASQALHRLLEHLE